MKIGNKIVSIFLIALSLSYIFIPHLQEGNHKGFNFDLAYDSQDDTLYFIANNGGADSNFVKIDTFSSPGYPELQYSLNTALSKSLGDRRVFVSSFLVNAYYTFISINAP